MNQEQKTALAKQRILEAAMKEFAERGYDGASLNTVCAENGISKGIIYHHFKDKDELYLLCAAECFTAAAHFLQAEITALNTPAPGTGSFYSTEQKLQLYFDARLRFFAENPLYQGIFSDTVFNPPAKLETQLSECRKQFDDVNISFLEGLLKNETLRKNISASDAAGDFRAYMDFFNMHFKISAKDKESREQTFFEHEKLCHRQIDILLYGVLGGNHEK